MTESDNLASFLKENKKLLRAYLETRLEIYKLKMIGVFSRSVGSILWIIISLFLGFLLMVFAGLVTGFWLSDLTGSYVAGFGYTTLIMLGIIILLGLLRKVLFINPIIRKVINRMDEGSNDNKFADN